MTELNDGASKKIAAGICCSYCHSLAVDLTINENET